MEEEISTPHESSNQENVQSQLPLYIVDRSPTTTHVGESKKGSTKVILDQKENNFQRHEFILDKRWLLVKPKAEYIY